MKLKDWNLNKVAEIKYKTSLKKLMRLISKSVTSFDNPESITSSLLNISGSKEFIDLSIEVATKFVGYLDQEENKTWRKLAEELGGSKAIAQVLAQSLDANVRATMDQRIRENAELITNMPVDVSEQITKYVSSETFKGLRADQISKQLQKKFDQYSESKLNLIARTEASKGTTALTEARAKDVGSMWYIWRTSNDGKRVRESHQVMQGVVCSWNEPPSPENLAGEKFVGYYHPGGIYNCRCWPQPVILLSQLRFPVKVHYGGQIRRMGKEEFMRIGGIV